MIPTKRPILLSLSAVAVLALAPSALGAGGLSLSPSIVEHAAKVGSVGTVVVDNSSATPLKVTVTPRPWKQALTGAVAPDKGKSLLSQVGVSARSFTLAAGSKKSITLTLKHGPSGGALYGAVDVIGLPTAAAKKKTSGVIPGYRLIGSLRLTPSAKKLRLRLGGAAVKRSSIVLPVRNLGNTIDPVGGRVRISGARGSRTVTVPATKVLPGAVVDLALGSVKGLPKGSYTAKATLTQAGKTVASGSKSFKIG